MNMPSRVRPPRWSGCRRIRRFEGCRRQTGLQFHCRRPEFVDERQCRSCQFECGDGADPDSCAGVGELAASLG